MKKYRTGLMIFAIIITIAQLIIIDYNDLSWSANAGSYLGILSMIALILNIIYSTRYDNKSI